MSIFDGELDSLPEGILVDTNILVLLILGAVDREAVSRFKRTKRFIPEDFDLARRFVSNFHKLGTTPSILTEASNLLNELNAPLSQSVLLAMARWIAAAIERYVPSRELILLPHYSKLGLADASISAVASSEFLVLTDDFKLSQVLESSGMQVVNFNHLRGIQWAGR